MHDFIPDVFSYTWFWDDGSSEEITLSTSINHTFAAYGDANVTMKAVTQGEEKIVFVSHIQQRCYSERHTCRVI